MQFTDDEQRTIAFALSMTADERSEALDHQQALIDIHRAKLAEEVGDTGPTAEEQRAHRTRQIVLFEYIISEIRRQYPV